MTKKILAMLLASAMVLSLAGCQENNSQGGGNDNQGGGNDNQGGGNSDNQGGSSSDDDVLTIVTWSSNSDVQNMVKIFCEKTGTPEDKVQLVTQGDSGGKGSTMIAQYLKGDGDADIITLEADWILSYINDSSLTAPLSAIGISESDLADPYPYTVDIGKNEAGDLMGVSFQATPGGFCYRADLAEQYLGVKSPEEMQAKIKDWDAFRATAKELYEASGETTALTATEGGLWQVFQANRTKAWVVDNALVMDNAVDFYDIAKEFADNKYLAGVPQWDPAWAAAIQSGAALGDFVPTWGMTGKSGSILGDYNGAQGDDLGSSPAFGNMAFCEGPTPYYWGGTWLGLAAKHNTDDLAAKFIKFFTCDAEGMKAYSTGTGDFCNNKPVMEAIVADGHQNESLKDNQDQFPIFLAQADDIDLNGKITKYDSVIKGHFNDSVNGYIDGTYATKDDAINAFKDAVAEDYPDLTIE